MASESPINRNRAAWNKTAAEYQLLHAEQLSKNPTAWGVWAVPEQMLGILGDVAGKDVLEFGCGGAQWSLALAGLGARVVGMDLSEGQLASALRARRNAPATCALVQASGECTPFADARFDLVFCDHGAMTFARPDYTVAEASRLLRPGGRFAFNSASPLLSICWNEESDAVSNSLQEDYFGIDAIEDDDGSVSYQRTYGDWIRLFRKHHLIVEDLVEIRPDPNAETTYPDFVPLEWARRWPAESLWILTRTPN